MFTRLSTWSNERLSIWNGSFASIGMSIVNGFVAMYLLDGLNATNGEMGMLNSLPALVNLFAMTFAAMVIRRLQAKKVLCAIATTISRSFYLWIALVPFFHLHQAALWVVWLVALIRVPQSFGDLTWQALIGDIIAPERRAAFFSDRNRMMTIVGLVVTFATGLFLQQFNIHSLWTYQTAFFTTAIFAVLEVYTLLKHVEPKRVQKKLQKSEKDGFSLRGALQSVCSDKKFMIALFSMLFFNFGWQLAWPLFNIYQIQTAHAPAFWLGLFTVANQVTQILTFRWWGRMSEKYGNVLMLGFAAVGMAVTPVLTILSTNMYYLLIQNVITGVPVAGTTLLLFNYLLEVSPDDKRTSYIAYYNVALSIVGFIAPEVGIWLLGNLGMNSSMTISTLLRFLGGLVFIMIAVFSRKMTDHRPVTPFNGVNG
jgi:MFS family permease